MTQGILDFTSPSRVNKTRLTGQNERLYRYLLTSKRIHCFSPAMLTLRIGYLNSRCSDLINKHHFPVQKKWTSVKDELGESVHVVEYFFDDEYLKSHRNEE